MTVNWFLTGALSIIGAIIISIIANLFTDPIKNWLAERSLISKRKRAEQLKSEYEHVLSMLDDRNKLALHLGNLAFLALKSLGISLITFSFMSFIISGLDVSKPMKEIIFTAALPGWEIVRQILFLILLIVALNNGGDFYNHCAEAVKLIRRIRFFDKYKKEMMSQLDKFETPVNITKR